MRSHRRCRRQRGAGPQVAVDAEHALPPLTGALVHADPSRRRAPTMTRPWPGTGELSRSAVRNLTRRVVVPAAAIAAALLTGGCTSGAASGPAAPPSLPPDPQTASALVAIAARFNHD